MGQVLCIDGPSGAGKGTASMAVAEALGFAYLDSGALYRILAVLAARKKIEATNTAELSGLAREMRVSFQDGQVLYKGDDISSEIRKEEVGASASKLAAIPEVRSALLELQRDYADSEGLVADGRDMGTVVFPDASLKIFLNASAEERARRRHAQLIEMDDVGDAKNDANQLIHKGDGDSLRALVKEIKARDERDSNRKVSPLRPAEDAIEIDSTFMSIEEVVSEVLKLWNQRSKS